MTKARDKLADTRRLQQVTWLALVSLAWLQLMLASHQFDHVGTYFDDSCHLCVQLERVGDVAVDGPGTATVPVAGFAEPTPPAPALVGRAVERGFDARAPPAL